MEAPGEPNPNLIGDPREREGVADAIKAEMDLYDAEIESARLGVDSVTVPPEWSRITEGNVGRREHLSAGFLEARSLAVYLGHQQTLWRLNNSLIYLADDPRTSVLMLLTVLSRLDHPKTVNPRRGLNIEAVHQEIGTLVSEMGVVVESKFGSRVSGVTVDMLINAILDGRVRIGPSIQ